MTADESPTNSQTDMSLDDEVETSSDSQESTPLTDSDSTHSEITPQAVTDDVATASESAVALADEVQTNQPETEQEHARLGSTEYVPPSSEHVTEENLGFDPAEMDTWIRQTQHQIEQVDDLIDTNTIDIQDNGDFDEDDFFTTYSGATTVVNRYDLEKAVSHDKKQHFVEEERYWVNKPFSFIIIFHSTKENEYKYYAIEPYITDIEKDVTEFLERKLRKSIKYSGNEALAGKDTLVDRAEVIEENTEELLDRFGIRGTALPNDSMFVKMARSVGLPVLGDDIREVRFRDDIEDYQDIFDSVKEEMLGDDQPALPKDDRDWVYLQPETMDPIPGVESRPEPAIIEEDSDKVTEYQIQKLLYYLKRDFVGYQRIDPIKNDINVEDISVDGYNQPVFTYHGDYEQIISNIFHGRDELDDFVVKLAQRSGKGISKRQPQVDCTLPDGSRAQLTLGEEVSDHGTNYTIRQFKDVPFTPVDLVCWNTFSLDQMAFLWLCIENHKSLIFAGGTASGKTTSLNAVSLFIPSGAKIVSIEDTREVELPQRNWIASVTRPSFSEDDTGDVDEFDLLEAALRQRPDYIVMGEIRGEEGRTAFQVMSTGHTTYTTFHADSVGEVLKRFTTDPINVSKTMFTALDLVSIQSATRVQGNKVRRNKVLTEVNGYEAETDEINVQNVYQWQAETDEFIETEGSEILESIQFDRGWNDRKLQNELLKRRTVLAYLLREDLNEYAQVAATIQAFITDPESVLRMVADETLEENLQNLRTMESVSIDIDQDDEEMVPRPTADGELRDEVDEVMEEAKEKIFSDMDGIDMSSTKSLKDVLSGSNSDEDLTIEPDDTDENDDSGGFLSDDTGDDDGDVPDFLKGSDSGSDSEVDDEEVLDLFGDDDSDSSDDLLGDTTGSESDSSPQDDIFDGDDSTDGTSSDSTDSDSEGSVFNAGGKEDPLEFDDDTVSDGEDDDVVHGSPAENTAGADSAAAVEQEEKRRKFAGMEDKNDSSWVFEDDSDELFVGDAFDDDGDDDDDGDEEGDGEGDGEGDDGDWVDMGDD